MKLFLLGWLFILTGIGIAPYMMLRNDVGGAILLCGSALSAAIGAAIIVWGMGRVN